jgi:Ca-activated chloride channel homolog
MGLVGLLAAMTSAWAGMGLKSVDFTVDVDGPLAEVVVQQRFVNEGREHIEATYVFPLHERAAVDGMRIAVNGRLVEGEVLEKRAAEAQYVDALSAGHVAALTLQERPNVFEQRVGNIPPGGEVVVWLRVVQPVPVTEGTYALTLPLVVGPRFVEDAVEQTRAATMPVEVPVAGPAVAEAPTGLLAGIDVVVDSGLALRGFGSPSHPVEVWQDGPWKRAVSGRVPMDRDFVLEWRVDGARPQAAMHVQEGHALIHLESPVAPPRAAVVPREFIWVVDQSGSMSGQPIEMVRETMLAALDLMDPRDSVRVLRFSNGVRGQAKSRPATLEWLSDARQQIQAMRAGGGTYMLDGVLQALKAEQDPERERTVIFLTDGLIGTETRVLSAIRDQVGSARLFGFGIGSSPNRWLLDEMARFGGGTTTWVRHFDDPGAEVARFVDTLDRPLLTDITVDWGDWEVEGVWPERIPALFAGQPMSLVARVLQEGSGPVVVRGRLGDSPFEATIEPRFSDPGRAVPSTWARTAIRHLEAEQLWGEVPELAATILDTSLEYQVLSQYTAFLAVDRGEVVNPNGAPSRRTEQAADRVHGMDRVTWQPGSTEEIVVESRRRAVQVESTSRGHVLSKDFLERIPVGRSYHSAVQLASGVIGMGNPNMGGSAYNQATYMLDGVNITDPVSGTLSVNLQRTRMEQLSLTTGGVGVEHPGVGGPLVEATSEAGTNRVEGSVSAGQGTGLGAEQALVATEVAGRLAGPLVRDHLFVSGGYGYGRTAVDDLSFQGHHVAGGPTVMTSPMRGPIRWSSTPTATGAPTATRSTPWARTPTWLTQTGTGSATATSTSTGATHSIRTATGTDFRMAKRSMSTAATRSTQTPTPAA